MSQDPDRSTLLRTDAVMADLQDRVRETLRRRIEAYGVPDAADRALFNDVDAILRAAVSLDDPGALLLPDLLPDEWRPELALRLTSHRGPIGHLLVFIKRRVLLPMMRWLFEYTQDNFRRQHRLNVALMGCVQALAVEHVRLAQEIARAGRAAAAEADAGPRAPGATIRMSPGAAAASPSADSDDGPASR